MTHPYASLLAGEQAGPLVDDLCRWHDRMVTHARRVGAAPSSPCCDDPGDCPRVEATHLWARAQRLLGARAEALTFLRRQATEVRRG